MPAFQPTADQFRAFRDDPHDLIGGFRDGLFHAISPFGSPPRPTAPATRTV